MLLASKSVKGQVSEVSSISEETPRMLPRKRAKMKDINEVLKQVDDDPKDTNEVFK